MQFMLYISVSGSRGVNNSSITYKTNKWFICYAAILLPVLI